ncbi:MAG: ABC transporter permease [Anderseniella sp.]|jgi:putative spermidine/putrescine transport system permease protein|nr:ABC transporter permease [Anderseniella sp.]
MNWLRRPASDTQITHGQRLWLYALSVIIMFLLVAPTLIVMPMSFSDSQYLEFPPREWSLRWYRNYFESIAWMDATWTSLQAALLTMLVATPVGVAAAYGLAVSRHALGRLVFLLLITPIMIPVILIAIGAFYAYVKLGLVNSMTGLVVAHTILALPLVLIVVSSALKSYDMSQEMAARSLGASRFRAFMLITLPQIRFSVITAALLSFLTSFDEVIVALFVSGGDNSTLTRNMFNALRDQIDPTIAAISTIMIVISSAMLVLAQVFGKPKD